MLGDVVHGHTVGFLAGVIAIATALDTLVGAE